MIDSCPERWTATEAASLVQLPSFQDCTLLAVINRTHQIKQLHLNKTMQTYMKCSDFVLERLKLLFPVFPLYTRLGLQQAQGNEYNSTIIFELTFWFSVCLIFSSHAKFRFRSARECFSINVAILAFSSS